MRLGLSSYVYRYALTLADPATGQTLSPEGILQRAADLELDMVQFCDNIPLISLTDEEARALRARGDELGVEVELGIGELDLAEARAYLRLGQLLGSKTLRVVAGGASSQVLIDRTRALLPDLHEADITLAYENYNEGLTTAELADLVRTIDDPAVRCCLDTCNAIGQQEWPAVSIENLLSSASQVHFKDYAIEKVVVGYHVVGRPLGQGWLDSADLMARIRQQGGDPDLMIEFWMPPGENIEDTLTKEQRWVAESAAALRALVRDTEAEE